MAALIREGKTFQIPSMMQTGKAAGMATLGDSLLELVKKKVVEPKEAWMKAVNKAEFKGLLERAGIARARGVISALTDDKDNLYVTVTAAMGRTLAAMIAVKTPMTPSVRPRSTK